MFKYFFIMIYYLFIYLSINLSTESTTSVLLPDAAQIMWQYLYSNLAREGAHRFVLRCLDAAEPSTI